MRPPIPEAALYVGKPPAPTQRSARGFTLIESLVAIGITSLLIAILLPAVEAARESARRANCANNLRQIGLALNNYISTSGSFPPAAIATVGADGREYLGYFSPHCRILPFLDQGPLFNSINFSLGTWPRDTYLAGPPPGVPPIDQINATVLNSNVALFLCPSDGGPFEKTGNNYRANAGIGPSFSPWIETPDSGNGIFPESKTVRPGDVPDGLSHTAAFSERLRGSGHPALNPERDYYQRKGIANTADQIMLACRASARPGASGFTTAGQFWFWTGRERTLYTHTQSPNGQVPDCTYGGMTPAIDMATARSHHPGGVNTLFGDGSVRFSAEATAQQVWRGLGTRNGSELVD